MATLTAYPVVHDPCPYCASRTLTMLDATVTESWMPKGTMRPVERPRPCIAVTCSSCEFVAEVKS